MRINYLRIITCLSVLFLKGVSSSPLLLFANRKNICLTDAGVSSNNITVIVSGLDDAAAVDYIYSNQTIYWTDVSTMSIQRASVNESQITISRKQYKPSRQAKKLVTRGLNSPDGIACDWLTHNLYWTDSESNRIEVSNLDGSNRKVLFWQDLDEPRAIALDPIRGYMYWTDWGERPKIERAAMDGNLQSREMLVDNDNIFWPNGITIDYSEERLYWMDSKLHYINSMKLDGSDRQTVLEEASPYPYSITVFQNNLYWTDWETKSIHTCNKRTGLNKSTIRNELFSPMNIHVFHGDRQPTAVLGTGGVNPCGSDNGGCSHLCLMSPYPPYYSCACPVGITLLADNKTCDTLRECLLLVRRPDIRRISLDTADYTDEILPLTNIDHAITVDYDPVHNYFYWTDDEKKSIERAKLDGTGQETLISSDLMSPDGIAIDWIAQNMYWIDSGLKRIEVARLNGSSRRVLIAHNLQEPRALALDPVAGYMYWTDWGSRPRIERAYLDGTNRNAIVYDPSVIGWPNGIALDLELRKIYWADAKLDSIQKCDMDGSNIEVVAQGEDKLPHVFGLTLLGDYVYWTDWQRRTVERINKNTKKENTLIVEHLPDLMGIKAVNVSHVQGTNPCQGTNNGCSHLCLHRPNGTVCGCPMSYELLHDGKTCVVPDAFLLFSRGDDIRRISLNTIKHNNMPIPVSGIRYAMSLDFDINEERIYWTDTELKTISRAFMNGSTLEHVVQFGLSYPEGMAVDWIARNLYWADFGTQRIEMSRLDGSSRKVLVWKDLHSPRSVAIDPANGFLYWTDWGDNPRIERASLDGTNRMVIVETQGRPNGLTIDYNDHRIYWTNLDEKRIESSDLLGGDKKPVVHEALPQPFSLTQYEDYIYWTDWTSQSIERANKVNGANRSTVQSNMQKIMDLLVFHKSRQSGSNACAVNNGGCSDLCVAKSEVSSNSLVSRCTCQTHYTLNPDKHTCTGPDDFLLFSVNDSITRRVMETDDTPDIILPLKEMRNIKAIAFDPIDQYIYWVNGKSNAIKRVKPSGTDYSVVLDLKYKNSAGSSGPFDIAIDPYGRFLYFTDDKTNVINVTSIQGDGPLKSLGPVISEKIKKSNKNQKPRKLALDPVEGVMFWINSMSPAKIEKARMDGTSDEVLFDNDLGQPSAITVDPINKKLYWADRLLHKIESCDYDGSNRKTLKNDDLAQPVGLAVYGNHLYWIDKKQQNLRRMNKLTGEEVTTVTGRVQRLSDLIAVSRISEQADKSHPCNVHNNQCSHLCFVDMTGKGRCSCPEGLVLDSDLKTCLHNLHCGPDKFECVQDSFCISLKWQCDGESDCTDESDEVGCRDCTDAEFRCQNGLCITKSQRCDGMKNCPAGEDEQMCSPCEDTFWECEDHTCIELSRRCNGGKDCGNGEDELDCAEYEKQNSSETGLKVWLKVFIVVSVLIFVVIIVTVVVMSCVRKRFRDPHPADEGSDTYEIIAVKEPLKKGVKNLFTAELPSTPPHTSSKKSGTTCMTVTSGTLTTHPSSDESLPYDRNHVTGASSSCCSTVTTGYPHETLNPPPSPVTDGCSHVTFNTSTSQQPPNSPSSTIPSYSHRHHGPRGKHRRHHHRHPHHHKKQQYAHVAPPTTPCSTDVCDDSESYLAPSPRRNKYYHQLSDSNYDSDVFYPPPPTPRSHCFSLGTEASCPPSPPSTEHSFNPYPPPPSPVGTSEC